MYIHSKKFRNGTGWRTEGGINLKRVTPLLAYLCRHYVSMNKMLYQISPPWPPFSFFLRVEELMDRSTLMDIAASIKAAFFSITQSSRTQDCYVCDDVNLREPCQEVKCPTIKWWPSRLHVLAYQWNQNSSLLEREYEYWIGSLEKISSCSGIYLAQLRL